MKGNFKVRCIKGFSHYTTKGKTYEVIDGRITYDHGAESFGRCYGIDELNEHFASQFELVSVPEITIRQKGRKVIAVMTEDGKYIKSAKAKCNPTDKFDFNIGSKLAFSRLMGEELAIKEVEAVHPAIFDWEGFKSGKFAVHCDTKEKFVEFLKECDGQGLRWLHSKTASDYHRYSEKLYYHHSNYLYHDTLDYIENKKKINIVEYNPSVREVKRPAKVGEWVRVVNAHNTHGNYDNGSILQIVPYSWASTTPHYKNEVGCYLAPDEYVVLENYQSESKPKTLADYTDKEILSEAVKRIEAIRDREG